MAINTRPEIVVKLVLSQITQIKDTCNTDDLRTMTQKTNLLDSHLVVHFVIKKPKYII